LKSLRTPPHLALLKILREQRETLGLTQKETARRLGHGQSWMSKNEIGERRIDVIEFARICKVLKLKPGRVIDELPGV
jgi:transcriptional regulator with XRE-family HTH domain